MQECKYTNKVPPSGHRRMLKKMLDINTGEVTLREHLVLACFGRKEEGNKRKTCSVFSPLPPTSPESNACVYVVG